MFILGIFKKMEWCVSESGKYKIKCLSAATFPGALRVMKEALFQDESVCIATEVNKNPAAAEELLELCAVVAIDGVSLVAVTLESEEVVAAIFSKLQVPIASESEKSFFERFLKERCKQPSSHALIQFMIDIDGRCNLFEKYKADCSLELMFLATLQEHRHQNLGTLLCKVSLDLAKKLKDGPVAIITLEDLGPKYMDIKKHEVTTKPPKICQSICTSIGTQKIMKALNFTLELTLQFNEFVYKGKTSSERFDNESSYFEFWAKVID